LGNREWDNKVKDVRDSTSKELFHRATTPGQGRGREKDTSFLAQARETTRL
jgi:hypothetical protein